MEKKSSMEKVKLVNIHCVLIQNFASYLQFLFSKGLINYLCERSCVFKSLFFLICFILQTASRPALGPTQPPIQCVPGALSLEVKRPGREAYHSPPSRSEVKN
jgi:hypothetical protein